jgi:hypothetical protein
LIRDEGPAYTCAMSLTGQKFVRRFGQYIAQRFLIALVAAGVMTGAAIAANAQQSDSSMAGMAGMGTPGGTGSNGGTMTAAEMKDMGPSMMAMAGHMYVTPLRPAQPGDEAKVKEMVAQIRASIERYKDYKNALADGYVIANPKVDQPQSHFINQANTVAAEHHFDPTKPSALLYFKTPTQHYKLEGVMFTMPPDASEDELNARIPLSMVRWHVHENFCAAPADKVKDYLGKHPKFGMFGSITTEDGCKAAGGQFYPKIFSWMIHVFPYEDNLKNQFSMNDDIPHFGSGGM